MTKKLKKEIKEMPKKFMAITMIIAMLCSYFSPITSVFAINTNSLSISFRDNSLGHGKVQYSLDDGNNWFDVTENFNINNITVTGENLRLKIVPNNNYMIDWAGIELNNVRISDLEVNGDFQSDDGYAVPANIESVSLENVEFKNDDGIVDDQQGGDPILNTFSNVNIHIEGEELEYNQPWTDDAADFIFGINNSSEMRRLSKNEVNYITENNKIVGLDTKNAINYQYNYNNEGTVTFHIRTQWDDVITSLKINGTSYNTPQTKTELISSFSERGIAFDISNVPYAETYNIEVIGGKQEEKIMGNFGWTYDPNTNEFSDDDKIPNGNLEFVKAVYDGVTYNSIEEVNAVGGVFEWHNGVKGSNDPYGEAMFPVGTELTIRLVPDTGYQLTSFDLNGNPFEPGEDPGLYTFTIGGGNWHLGAHFTEVGDEVQPNSENVISGEISINKSGNENFENGTAKLEVDDVASMSPNRMEEFENTANDEGYEIENYLDISLYNSIYKGGLKDNNGKYESWDTPVDNLADNATITLELEDNMNGKDLVIVHEKHNGNEIIGYELIDAVYNAENNTITFETDSFSNYAIASKQITNATKYIVKFDSNGGSEVPDKEVTAGYSVAEPTTPTKEGFSFDGWYVDKTLTTRFDFNTPITDNVKLYAKWVDNNKQYKINDNFGNTISFKDEDGHTYSLKITDYLTFTEEDLEAAEIPKEMFDQVLDALKNLTKNYGKLLAFYEIEVSNEDGYLKHDGPFKIKIKVTDEMKKYNQFILMYIDMENDFATEKPITLIKEGDYLVGTLNHLSTYVLAGNNVSNPHTGDSINIWGSMLGISIIGLSLGTYTTVKSRKKKLNKDNC